jgi:hypothetical protein
VEGFLEERTATQNVDNLIIRYQNVDVTVNGTAYYINYEIVPNWPVNFLFFTGTMIES